MGGGDTLPLAAPSSLMKRTSLSSRTTSKEYFGWRKQSFLLFQLPEQVARRTAAGCHGRVQECGVSPVGATPAARPKWLGRLHMKVMESRAHSSFVQINSSFVQIFCGRGGEKRLKMIKFWVRHFLWAKT